MSQSDFSGEPLPVLSLMLLPLPPVVTGWNRAAALSPAEMSGQVQVQTKMEMEDRQQRAIQVAYVGSQSQAQRKSLSQ